MITVSFKKTIVGYLLLLSFTLLANTANAIEVGDELQIDQLETIDGQVLTRESLKDKHLVIQVWATWCPYCHRQNLNLIELAKQTKGMPLEIIALSIDKKPDVVPAYALKHNLNFPVAMMTPALNEAIGKRRGGPELYVVDPSGKVVQKEWGEMIDLDVFDLADYAKK